MNFNFKVNHDHLILCGKSKGYTENMNYYVCVFEFSEEWERYEKFAVFSYMEDAVEKIIGPVAIFDGKCNVPYTVLQEPAAFRVGVFGVLQEEGEMKRIVTGQQSIDVEEGCFPEESMAEQTPEPTVWESYVAELGTMLERAVPVIGADANWHLYDPKQGTYVNTGMPTKGADGYTPKKGIDYFTAADMQTLGVANKVDKEPGKGLSSNDFTDADKAKLHTHNNHAVLDGISDVLVNGWNDKTNDKWRKIADFTHDGDSALYALQTTQDLEGKSFSLKKILIAVKVVGSPGIVDYTYWQLFLNGNLVASIGNVLSADTTPRYLIMCYEAAGENVIGFYHAPSTNERSNPSGTACYINRGTITGDGINNIRIANGKAVLYPGSSVQIWGVDA